MRKWVTLTAVAALAFLTVGCAITDYDGIIGHNTQSEAKLWGQEISFSGTGDPALDGTYSYTVKYDNRVSRGAVTINSYRNPVVSSFKRDGVVDVDGDDIQGSSGVLGGKFLPYFKAVDRAVDCQFFDNITFSKVAGGPAIALCNPGFLEEVDKDLDLQASFSSVGHMLNQIWSGSLRGNFTMEVTEVVINGSHIPVSPFSVGAYAAPLRPGRFVIDASQPNTGALISAILSNTQHMVPVNFGMVFAGGMSFNLPGSAKVAFNHDALWALAN